CHRTEDWRVLESAWVSYGKATPYFPVLELVRRYCHVEEADDARTMRQGDRTGTDVGRDTPGGPAGAAGTPGRAADGQPVCQAGPVAASSAHARRAEARTTARKPGAAAAPGV